MTYRYTRRIAKLANQLRSIYTLLTASLVWNPVGLGGLLYTLPSEPPRDLRQVSNARPCGPLVGDLFCKPGAINSQGRTCAIEPRPATMLLEPSPSAGPQRSSRKTYALRSRLLLGSQDMDPIEDFERGSISWKKCSIQSPS